jgi:molybdopterin synthase catalytic subunit
MRPEVGITKRPVSVDAVIKAVQSESAGGTVVFIGTVRNRSDGMRISRLEIEAAEELARRDLTRIAGAASKRFDVCKISICHRIGNLRVGDVIIAIAVSSPHRKDAFAACTFMIDELKKTTPIWKKECGRGKEIWVESER